MGMNTEYGRISSTGSASRREFLLELAVIAPAALFLRPTAGWAQGGEDGFLEVSRIVTGTDALSPEGAARIKGLLAAQIDGFEDKLSVLAAALREAGGDRASMLGALSGDRVDFALAIARPWYLGYVGDPSSFVLKDDAQFATFLEAQGWEKIVAEVPRITYPGGAAGWWDTAPPGVTAPAMPDGIAGWTFRPDGPAQIMGIPTRPGAPTRRPITRASRKHTTRSRKPPPPPPHQQRTRPPSDPHGPRPASGAPPPRTGDFPWQNTTRT